MNIEISTMHDILEMLFVGHVHKWFVISKGPLRNDVTGSTGTRYVLQCLHCGNIKYVDVIV
jgi:hypothetical protein